MKSRQNKMHVDSRPRSSVRRQQYLQPSTPTTPRAYEYTPQSNGNGNSNDNGYGIGNEVNDEDAQSGNRPRNQSWGSVTRDSVVDNLLLSFDRMGTGMAPNEDELDRSSTSFTPPRAFQRLQQRVRGHTYSSSVTSSPPSTITSNNNSLPRDRDNNNTLPRDRDNNNTRPRDRDNSIESQRTARNILQSRGSTVNSNRFGSYSSHAGDDLTTHTQGTPEVVSHPILDRGRPVPSVFSSFEVPQNHCHEPRVPGGPSYAPSLTASHRTMAANDANNPDIPQTIRDQAMEFVRQTNMRAASPSSSSSRPDASQSQTSSLQNQTSASDTCTHRPGFFRRVFGSAARVNSFPDHPSPYVRENSAMTTDTAVSTSPAPPPAAAAPPQPRADAPVVNKKPSSFFRRRKKSTSELGPPPALPDLMSDAPPTASKHFPPASPGVSSLRLIMDQYLGNPDAHPQLRPQPVPGPTARLVTPDTDEEDALDLFHSGYTPPPDASPRRPEPLDHPGSVSTKSATPVVRQKPFKTSPRLGDEEPDRPSQNLQADTATFRPGLVQANSFLSDNSDLDGSNASSLVSAISDTYALPDGSFSPISPMTQSLETFPVPPPHLSPQSHLPSQLSQQPEYLSDEVKPTTSVRDPTAPNRLWLSPSPSVEEDIGNDDLALPLEGPRVPEKDSSSQLPVFQLDGNLVRPSVEVARGMLGKTNGPTAEERNRAQKIYDGDELHVTKDEAAPWLGEKTAVSARTLAAYMSLFDFSGRNIVSGLRGLCDRLVLKGESQQVDRILDAFSRRWDECNPKNGFKGPSVVHAICYALLLLNTDQHVADIQHKMTRSEFVKNTMPAVRAAAESTIKPNPLITRPVIPWQDSDASTPISSSGQDEEDRSSVDFKRSMKRLSYRPGMGRFDTDPGPGDHDHGSANHLVHYPFEGSERQWLSEVENVLKAFYSSIVAEALPLHGSQAALDKNMSANGPHTLNVTGGILRRTGSVISKAPSEGFSYRSRRGDISALSSRWNAKNRSRQKIYPASTVGSSRTSFDDGRSAWSPSAQSSMWSKISMGRTQTTMSVESFAVHGDFKQSLGFTNALSQAIIREEASGDTESVMKVGTVLEDESLELAGAPWAKEGMVKHKHHLEGPDKKAKERSWNECFSVVEKGYLHLFSFNRATTKISNTRGPKPKSAKASGGAPSAPSVVGGGNWTDSADELGQFLLRQTLATVLPSPGYSKTRPHVWALSLPSGAVHLFQVGTAEIAEEFVSTANYWSARLSKEPLIGGVDSFEYGWSENIINPALIGNGNSDAPNQSPSRHGTQHGHSTSVGNIGGSRPSMQSSIRGSLDQSFGSRSRLPGDRAHISDWKPPAASMLPSQLLEIDQLRSLKAYVASVQTEFERHNELRNAVNIAYSSRSGNNWSKVMSNWEKKSAYLLREVVKFRTYIEALEKAGREKEKIYEERKTREEERVSSRGTT